MISNIDLEALKSLISDFVYDVLGLKEETSQTDDLTSLMDFIIKLRAEAKANKDYALSDKIRIGLEQIGLQLKDGKEGTTWNKM
jgi:cysteinyl-tRNA synthetase